MRVIATLLVITNIAFDIVWAYPDTMDSNRNLAVTGLQNKQSIARMAGSLIALGIERGDIRSIDHIEQWFAAHKNSFEGIKLEREQNSVLLLVKDGERQQLAVRFYDHTLADQIGTSSTRISDYLSMEILEDPREALAKTKETVTLSDAARETQKPTSDAVIDREKAYLAIAILSVLVPFAISQTMIRARNHIGRRSMYSAQSVCESPSGKATAGSAVVGFYRTLDPAIGAEVKASPSGNDTAQAYSYSPEQDRRDLAGYLKSRPSPTSQIAIFAALAEADPAERSACLKEIRGYLAAEDEIRVVALSELARIDPAARSECVDQLADYTYADQYPPEIRVVALARLALIDSGEVPQEDRDVFRELLKDFVYIGRNGVRERVIALGALASFDEAGVEAWIHSLRDHAEPGNPLEIRAAACAELIRVDSPRREAYRATLRDLAEYTSPIEVQIAALAALVRAEVPAPSAVEQLSPSGAVLPNITGDSEEVVAELRRMEIDENAIFVDFDHTLITESSPTLWALDLIKRSWQDHGVRVAWSRILWSLKKMITHAIKRDLRSTFRLFAGSPKDLIDQLARRLTLNEHLLEVLREIKAKQGSAALDVVVLSRNASNIIARFLDRDDIRRRLAEEGIVVRCTIANQLLESEDALTDQLVTREHVIDHRTKLLYLPVGNALVTDLKDSREVFVLLRSLHSVVIENITIGRLAVLRRVKPITPEEGHASPSGTAPTYEVDTVSLASPSGSEGVNRAKEEDVQIRPWSEKEFVLPEAGMPVGSTIEISDPQDFVPGERFRGFRDNVLYYFNHREPVRDSIPFNDFLDLRTRLVMALPEDRETVRSAVKAIMGRGYNCPTVRRIVRELVESADDTYPGIVGMKARQAFIAKLDRQNRKYELPFLFEEFIRIYHDYEIELWRARKKQYPRGHFPVGMRLRVTYLGSGLFKSSYLIEATMPNNRRTRRVVKIVYPSFGFESNPLSTEQLMAVHNLYERLSPSVSIVRPKYIEPTIFTRNLWGEGPDGPASQIVTDSSRGAAYHSTIQVTTEPEVRGETVAHRLEKAKSDGERREIIQATVDFLTRTWEETLLKQRDGNKDFRAGVFIDDPRPDNIMVTPGGRFVITDIDFLRRGTEGEFLRTIRNYYPEYFTDRPKRTVSKEELDRKYDYACKRDARYAAQKGQVPTSLNAEQERAVRRSARRILAANTEHAQLPDGLLTLTWALATHRDFGRKEAFASTMMRIADLITRIHALDFNEMIFIQSTAPSLIRHIATPNDFNTAMDLAEAAIDHTIGCCAVLDEATYSKIDARSRVDEISYAELITRMLHEGRFNGLHDGLRTSFKVYNEILPGKTRRDPAWRWREYFSGLRESTEYDPDYDWPDRPSGSRYGFVASNDSASPVSVGHLMPPPTEPGITLRRIVTIALDASRDPKEFENACDLLVSEIGWYRAMAYDESTILDSLELLAQYGDLRMLAMGAMLERELGTTRSTSKDLEEALTDVQPSDVNCRDPHRVMTGFGKIVVRYPEPFLKGFIEHADSREMMSCFIDNLIQLDLVDPQAFRYLPCTNPEPLTDPLLQLWGESALDSDEMKEDAEIVRTVRDPGRLQKALTDHATQHRERKRPDIRHVDKRKSDGRGGSRMTRTESMKEAASPSGSEGIDRAKEDDVDAICRLSSLLPRGASSRKTTQRIIEEGDQSGVVLLVYRNKKGKVVGYTAGAVRSLLPPETFIYGDGMILEIAVEKKYQRQGIGQQLWDAMWKALRIRGVKSIFVQAQHPGTARLASKSGMVGERKSRVYYWGVVYDDEESTLKEGRTRNYWPKQIKWYTGPEVIKKSEQKEAVGNASPSGTDSTSGVDTVGKASPSGSEGVDRATIDDVGAICWLSSLLPGGASSRETTQRIIEEGEKSGFVFLVYRNKKGKVVGYTAGAVRSLLPPESFIYGDGMILEIAVDKKYQRQGIGQQLWDAMWKALRIRGVKSIFVQAQHPGTARLASKSGMVGERKSRVYYWGVVYDDEESTLKEGRTRNYWPKQIKWYTGPEVIKKSEQKEAASPSGTESIPEINAGLTQKYDLIKSRMPITVDDALRERFERARAKKLREDGSFNRATGEGLYLLAGVPLPEGLTENIEEIQRSLMAIEPDPTKLYLRDPEVLHVTVAELYGVSDSATPGEAPAKERDGKAQRVCDIIREGGFSGFTARFSYEDITISEKGDLIALGYLVSGDLFAIRGALGREEGLLSRPTDIIHITLGRIYDAEKYEDIRKIIENLRAKRGSEFLGEFTARELLFYDQTQATDAQRYGPPKYDRITLSLPQGEEPVHASPSGSEEATPQEEAERVIGIVVGKAERRFERIKNDPLMVLEAYVKIASRQAFSSLFRGKSLADPAVRGMVFNGDLLPNVQGAGDGNRLMLMAQNAATLYDEATRDRLINNVRMNAYYELVLLHLRSLKKEGYIREIILLRQRYRQTQDEALRRRIEKVFRFLGEDVSIEDTTEPDQGEQQSPSGIAATDEADRDFQERVARAAELADRIGIVALDDYAFVLPDRLFIPFQATKVSREDAHRIAGSVVSLEPRMAEESQLRALVERWAAELEDIMRAGNYTQEELRDLLDFLATEGHEIYRASQLESEDRNRAIDLIAHERHHTIWRRAKRENDARIAMLEEAFRRLSEEDEFARTLLGLFGHSEIYRKKIKEGRFAEEFWTHLASHLDHDEQPTVRMISVYDWNLGSLSLRIGISTAREIWERDFRSLQAYAEENAGEAYSINLELAQRYRREAEECYSRFAQEGPRDLAEVFRGRWQEVFERKRSAHQAEIRPTPTMEDELPPSNGQTSPSGIADFDFECGWEEKVAKLEAIPSLIGEDPSQATEENLGRVLRCLSPSSDTANHSSFLNTDPKRSEFVIRAVLKTLPTFVSNNPASFSEANLEIVLCALGWDDQGPRFSLFVRRAIPFFVEANPVSFTESNFRILLSMLDHENVYVRRAALGAYRCFLMANSIYDTSENRGSVRAMSNRTMEMYHKGSWVVAVAASETLKSFIEPRRASFGAEVPHVLRPINLQEELAESGLSAEQIELIQRYSKGILTLYDFLDTLPNTVCHGGYLLGLENYPNLDKIHWALSEACGVTSWRTAWNDAESNYRHFWDKMTTENVLDDMINNRGTIVFCIPRNAMDASQYPDSITREEIELLLAKPERMRNAYFVFGAYDVVSEEDYQDFILSQDEEEMRDRMVYLLRHHGQYMIDQTPGHQSPSGEEMPQIEAVGDVQIWNMTGFLTEDAVRDAEAITGRTRDHIYYQSLFSGKALGDIARYRNERVFRPFEEDGRITGMSVTKALMSGDTEAFRAAYEVINEMGRYAGMGIVALMNGTAVKEGWAADELRSAWAETRNFILGAGASEDRTGGLLMLAIKAYLEEVGISDTHFYQGKFPGKGGGCIGALTLVLPEVIEEARMNGRGLQGTGVVTVDVGKTTIGVALTTLEDDKGDVRRVVFSQEEATVPIPERLIPSVGVVDGNGVVREYTADEVREGVAIRERTMDIIAQLIVSAMDAADKEGIMLSSYIGFSVPGMTIDNKESDNEMSAVPVFPKVENYSFTEDLRTRLESLRPGTSGLEMRLINDGVAAGLAELRYGLDASTLEDGKYAYLGPGTGLGSGLYRVRREANAAIQGAPQASPGGRVSDSSVHHGAREESMGFTIDSLREITLDLARANSSKEEKIIQAIRILTTVVDSVRDYIECLRQIDALTGKSFAEAQQKALSKLLTRAEDALAALRGDLSQDAKIEAVESFLRYFAASGRNLMSATMDDFVTGVANKLRGFIFDDIIQHLLNKIFEDTLWTTALREHAQRIYLDGDRNGILGEVDDIGPYMVRIGDNISNSILDQENQFWAPPREFYNTPWPTHTEDLPSLGGVCPEYLHRIFASIWENALGRRPTYAYRLDERGDIVLSVSNTATLSDEDVRKMSLIGCTNKADDIYSPIPGGRGIGIPLARILAQFHNFDYSIASDPAKQQITVTVRIPRAEIERGRKFSQELAHLKGPAGDTGPASPSGGLMTRANHSEGEPERIERLTAYPMARWIEVTDSRRGAVMPRDTMIMIQNILNEPEFSGLIRTLFERQASRSRERPFITIEIWRDRTELSGIYPRNPNTIILDRDVFTNLSQRLEQLREARAQEQQVPSDESMRRLGEALIRLPLYYELYRLANGANARNARQATYRYLMDTYPTKLQRYMLFQVLGERDFDAGALRNRVFEKDYPRLRNTRVVSFIFSTALSGIIFWLLYRFCPILIFPAFALLGPFLFFSYLDLKKEGVPKVPADEVKRRLVAGMAVGIVLVWVAFSGRRTIDILAARQAIRNKEELERLEEELERSLQLHREETARAICGKMSLIDGRLRVMEEGYRNRVTLAFIRNDQEDFVRRHINTIDPDLMLEILRFGNPRFSGYDAARIKAALLSLYESRYARRFAGRSPAEDEKLRIVVNAESQFRSTFELAWLAQLDEDGILDCVGRRLYKDLQGRRKEDTVRRFVTQMQSRLRADGVPLPLIIGMGFFETHDFERGNLTEDSERGEAFTNVFGVRYEAGSHRYARGWCQIVDDWYEEVFLQLRDRDHVFSAGTAYNPLDPAQSGAIFIRKVRMLQDERSAWYYPARYKDQIIQSGGIRNMARFIIGAYNGGAGSVSALDWVRRFETQKDCFDYDVVKQCLKENRALKASGGQSRFTQIENAWDFHGGFREGEVITYDTVVMPFYDVVETLAKPLSDFESTDGAPSGAGEAQQSPSGTEEDISAEVEQHIAEAEENARRRFEERRNDSLSLLEIYVESATRDVSDVLFKGRSFSDDQTYLFVFRDDHLPNIRTAYQGALSTLRMPHASRIPQETREQLYRVVENNHYFVFGLELLRAMRPEGYRGLIAVLQERYLIAEDDGIRDRIRRVFEFLGEDLPEREDLDPALSASKAAISAGIEDLVRISQELDAVFRRAGGLETDACLELFETYRSYFQDILAQWPGYRYLSLMNPALRSWMFNDDLLPEIRATYESTLFALTDPETEAILTGSDIDATLDVMRNTYTMVLILRFLQIRAVEGYRQMVHLLQTRFAETEDSVQRQRISDVLGFLNEPVPQSGESADGHASPSGTVEETMRGFLGEELTPSAREDITVLLEDDYRHGAVEPVSMEIRRAMAEAIRQEGDRLRPLIADVEEAARLIERGAAEIVGEQWVVYITQHPLRNDIGFLPSDYSILPVLSISRVRQEDGVRVLRVDIPSRVVIDGDGRMNIGGVAALSGILSAVYDIPSNIIEPVFETIDWPDTGSGFIPHAQVIGLGDITTSDIVQINWLVDQVSMISDESTQQRLLNYLALQMSPIRRPNGDQIRILAACGYLFAVRGNNEELAKVLLEYGDIPFIQRLADSESYGLAPAAQIAQDVIRSLSFEAQVIGHETAYEQFERMSQEARTVDDGGSLCAFAERNGLTIEERHGAHRAYVDPCTARVVIGFSVNDASKNPHLAKKRAGAVAIHFRLQYFVRLLCRIVRNDLSAGRRDASIIRLILSNETLISQILERNGIEEICDKDGNIIGRSYEGILRYIEDSSLVESDEDARMLDRVQGIVEGIQAQRSETAPSRRAARAKPRRVSHERAHEAQRPRTAGVFQERSREERVTAVLIGLNAMLESIHERRDRVAGSLESVQSEPALAGKNVRNMARNIRKAEDLFLGIKSNAGQNTELLGDQADGIVDQAQDAIASMRSYESEARRLQREYEKEVLISRQERARPRLHPLVVALTLLSAASIIILVVAAANDQMAPIMVPAIIASLIVLVLSVVDIIHVFFGRRIAMTQIVFRAKNIRNIQHILFEIFVMPFQGEDAQEVMYLMEILASERPGQKGNAKHKLSDILSLYPDTRDELYGYVLLFITLIFPIEANRSLVHELAGIIARIGVRFSAIAPGRSVFVVERWKPKKDHPAYGQLKEYPELVKTLSAIGPGELSIKGKRWLLGYVSQLYTLHHAGGQRIAALGEGADQYLQQGPWDTRSFRSRMMSYYRSRVRYQKALMFVSGSRFGFLAWPYILVRDFDVVWRPLIEPIGRIDDERKLWECEGGILETLGLKGSWAQPSADETAGDTAHEDTRADEQRSPSGTLSPAAQEIYSRVQQVVAQLERLPNGTEVSEAVRNFELTPHERHVLLSFEDFVSRNDTAFLEYETMRESPLVKVTPETLERVRSSVEQYLDEKNVRIMRWAILLHDIANYRNMPWPHPVTGSLLAQELLSRMEIEGIGQEEKSLIVWLIANHDVFGNIHTGERAPQYLLEATEGLSDREQARRFALLQVFALCDVRGTAQHGEYGVYLTDTKANFYLEITDRAALERMADHLYEYRIGRWTGSLDGAVDESRNAKALELVESSPYRDRIKSCLGQKIQYTFYGLYTFAALTPEELVALFERIAQAIPDDFDRVTLVFSRPYRQGDAASERMMDELRRILNDPADRSLPISFTRESSREGIVTVDLENLGRDETGQDRSQQSPAGTEQKHRLWRALDSNRLVPGACVKSVMDREDPRSAAQTESLACFADLFTDGEGGEHPYYLELQAKNAHQAQIAISDQRYAASLRTIHAKEMNIAEDSSDPTVFNLADRDIIAMAKDGNSLLYRIFETINPRFFSFHIGYSVEKMVTLTADGLRERYVGTSPIGKGRDEIFQIIRDTIREICVTLESRKFSRDRVLIESLNYSDLPSEGAYDYICEPDFIKGLLKETGVGFLADCAHLLISAEALPGYRDRPFMDYVQDVINQETIAQVREVHLAIPEYLADINCIYDSHLPFSTHTAERQKVLEIFKYILEQRRLFKERTGQDLGELVIVFETGLEEMSDDMLAIGEFLESLPDESDHTLQSPSGMTSYSDIEGRFLDSQPVAPEDDTTIPDQESPSGIIDMSADITSFSIPGYDPRNRPSVELEYALEEVRFSQGIGSDIVREVTRLDHDLTTYTIPINVDILPKVSEANGQALKEVLETIARKQLYLNRRYGAHKIQFAFVRVTPEGSLTPETNHNIVETYRSLELVQDYHLEAATACQDAVNSFVITTPQGLPKDVRPLVLKDRLSLSDQAGLYLWNTILDIAIAQTVLMGQDEATRQQYYPALMRLYSLLGCDMSSITTKALSALFGEDIPQAVSLALQLSIPPAGTFDLDTLLLLYEQMNLVEEYV